MNDVIRLIRTSLLLAACGWTGVAGAQEDPYPSVLFPGPVDVTALPAVAPEPTPAPAAAVPVDPNQPRPWLAAPRAEADRVTPSGSLGPWLLVGLLGVVGGAWWLQRRKRARKIDERLGGLQINVLANNRIGPKAHAVVVEFGGKVLVLGVTDSHVSCLDTVTQDELLAARSAPERELERGNERPAAAKSSTSATFQAYLDRSLEIPDSAALHLAESTVDRTQLRTKPREEILDIEGQAAGLAARLRKGIKQG